MIRSKMRYALRARLRRDAAKAFLIGIVLLALPELVAHPVLSEAMAPLGLLGGVLAACGAVVMRLAPREPADVRPAHEDGEPTVALSRSPLPGTAGTGDPDADARETMLTDLEGQPKPFEWSHSVLERIDPRRFGALVECVYRQAGFETCSARHGVDDLVWLHAPRAKRNRPVSTVLS